MGCQPSRDPHSIQSEVPNEIEEEMAERLEEPAPPAPTDPRLPLTALQVFKLKKSWKGIKRCMEATGVEMFIRLFRSNNGLQHLFKEFRDIDSNDDLRTNELLAKHSNLVMALLDETICNIDNVDYVLEIISRAGKSHARFEGFTPDLFVWMEKPFLEAVKLTLGDRYTDNMDVIYKLTIKFVLSHMVKANNELT
ncbi:globin-5-like [Gigantopelta aegis]|uniref:globin-5-like n=1 Tax=Gigantopelta aegis TaxID=1735272 RepID=UPI001B888AD6|nr:globin-5-like [Gigantopelta aegis]